MKNSILKLTTIAILGLTTLTPVSVTAAPAPATVSAEYEAQVQNIMNKYSSQFAQIENEVSNMGGENPNGFEVMFNVSAQVKWKIEDFSFDVPQMTWKMKEMKFDTIKSRMERKVIGVVKIPKIYSKMCRIGLLKTKCPTTRWEKKVMKTDIPVFWKDRTSIKTKIPQFSSKRVEIKTKIPHFYVKDVKAGLRKKEKQAKALESRTNKLVKAQEQELNSAYSVFMVKQREIVKEQKQLALAKLNSEINNLEQQIKTAKSNKVDPTNANGNNLNALLQQLKTSKQYAIEKFDQVLEQMKA